MKFLPTHGGHHLVKFTGQAFFFPKAGKIADVVNEHPAVNGHRASHRRVGLEGSDDGGKVAREEPFHGVG